MNNINTTRGGINIGKVQTGWSVEKQTDGTWNLKNFDDETVYNAKTKKACLQHYADWYIH